MTSQSLRTPFATSPTSGASLTPAAVAGQPASPFLLHCDDGRELAAHWVEPADGAAHAVAVINSAAAVPRRFYRNFAQWLAARGYAVLSYDYRGIGDSRRGDLRADPATMREWTLLDTAAALAAAQSRRQSAGSQRGHPRVQTPTQTPTQTPIQAHTQPQTALPLLVIGHSFGGHAVGFTRGIDAADAVLTIAAQEGYWRNWSGGQRLLTGAFFGLWLPLMARLYGHLPSWALGPGAQAMPRGVALDWSRWGCTPGYFFGDPAMHAHSQLAAISAPVHLWSIHDDRAYAPAVAVDALAQRFRYAAVQRHHLAPADVGQQAIGHFGMFRSDAGAAIWPRWLDAIEQAAPALRRRA